MPLTVRLSPKSERVLDALARRRRLSRSDIVREAIAQFGMAEDVQDGQPYAAWLDVIGVVALGARDVARTTGEQFADILADKSRARRSR